MYFLLQCAHAVRCEARTEEPVCAGKTPAIVEVPAMQFVAVRGAGDPNDPHGEYQSALQLLYGISFTIKMSEKIQGFT